MNRDLLPLVVVDPFGIDVLTQRYEDSVILCQMAIPKWISKLFSKMSRGLMKYTVLYIHRDSSLLSFPKPTALSCCFQLRVTEAKLHWVKLKGRFY